MTSAANIPRPAALPNRTRSLVAIGLSVTVLWQATASPAWAQFIIGQKPGTDFLAFEAEDVFEFVNGDDETGWGAVGIDEENPSFVTKLGVNVLPADTSASRQAAIFDFPDGSVDDFARFRMQFVEPGDYSLYISYTMFDVDVNDGYGNEDSIYVSSEFGTNGELIDTPADPRGDRDSRPSFYGNPPGGGLELGRWEGQFEWWNAEADGSDPTANNTEAIYTPALNTSLDFGIAARERGIAIDKIVFHTNPDLSAEELDAIPTFAPNTGDPGDFNADGAVDLADFGIMAANFNGAFPVAESFAKGDQTRDGRVDLADFLVTREIFSVTPEGATASVPEPAGLLSLAVTGGLATAMLRRLRRRLL